MPLYLDNTNIALRFTHDVAEALRQVKAATANRAISPDIAVTQIRRHLGQLLGAEHQDILSKLRPASWDVIHWAFVELAFRSSGQDARLQGLSAAMQVIYSYSTSPPRQLEFPPHIEVTHFLRMWAIQRSRGQDLSIHAYMTELPMFQFCKYCWRQAVPRRKICSVHAPAKFLQLEPRSPDVHGPGSKSAEYKDGQRYRVRFDQAVTALVTREVLEFHNSDFQAKVLFERHEIAEWLTIRRPQVWRLTHKEGIILTNHDLLERMLNLLYDMENLPHSVDEPYREARNAISKNPILAWPILTRLEAFLQRKELTSGHRGGARIGAGRKRVSF